MQSLLGLLLLPLTSALYTLEVFRQPSEAVAGQPFGVQPAVALYDDDYQIAASYVGFCSTLGYVTPTGTEQVLRNGTSGQAATRVPFVDGYAVFDGLYINVAGTYKLQFVAEDPEYSAFASAYSDAYEAEIGPAFQIRATAYPSGGVGGTPFSMQPQIAIYDLGGNVINTWNTGALNCEILDTDEYPNPTKAILKPEAKTEAYFAFGEVGFDSLYIDEAGGPYYLRFTAMGFGDVQLPGGIFTDIPEITIYVGSPYMMEVLDDASVNAFGGSAFSQQPRLRIADAGSNTVVDDSSSLVVATLTQNPTLTTFNSADHAYQVAEFGLVTFTNLGIKATGKQYQVTYTLFSYSTSTQKHTETSVKAVSAKIDVTPGPAARLGVITFPSEAIAGGSAFGTQPELALQDRGGNALAWASITDSTYQVEADIAPSLGTDWVGVVYTAGDSNPGVIDVNARPGKGTNPTGANEPGSVDGLATLAGGDLIDVELTFNFDVIGHADRGVPSLELNIRNRTGHYARAVCVSLGAWSTVQTFQYIVQDGDSSSSTKGNSSSMRLDATAKRAVSDNGGPFWDPYYRAVNATLPVGQLTLNSLANNTPFAVDTSRPRATNVSLAYPTVPGVYAPGTILRFNVSYDAAVEVVFGASPSAGVFLPILIAPSQPSPAPSVSPTPGPTPASQHGDARLNNTQGPTPQPIDYGETSYAAYASGSGSLVLVFEYLVLPGQDSGGSPVRLPINATTGGFQLRLDNGARIYRRSSTPSTIAYSTINSSSVEASGVILDNAKPSVNRSYGVRALSPNGTYYAGDTILLSVGFDSIVELNTANFFLYLDVGFKVSAFYVSGAPGKVLTFQYVVSEDERSDHLNLYGDGSQALAFSGLGGYLRKASDAPSVDADLNLRPARYSLINTSKIVVDGRPPAITRCGISRRRKDDGSEIRKKNTTVVDDIVTIFFMFDKPVVVFGKPTLDLDAHEPAFAFNPDRVASYSSGNGSEVLEFVYIPRIGDKTPRLGITTSYTETLQGYQDGAFGGEGSIMLASESPTVYANTRLYTAASADRYYGNPLHFGGLPNIKGINATNTTAVNAREPRPTRVAEVLFGTDDGVGGTPGTYGAGDRFKINIRFTDEVVFVDPPSIFLNTGGEALYIRGTGTDTYEFIYFITEDDVEVERFAVADVNSIFDPGIPGYPSSCIWCNTSATCGLFDILGVAVNISMGNLSGALQLPPGYAIDVTPPYITDVWCRTPKSPYAPLPYGPYAGDANWYSVGERLEFSISFHRDVALTEEAPLLKLGLGANAPYPYALFEAFDGKRILNYAYTIQQGDFTQNLTLKGIMTRVDALYLDASVTTTLANLSLDHHNLRGKQLGANRSSEPIEVITDRAPTVSNCSFRDVVAATELVPGDQITVLCAFSSSVSVVGTPVLMLNANVDAEAQYSGGSGTAMLSFDYRVQPGDVVLRLAYTDSFAMRRGRIRAADHASDKVEGRGRITALGYTPTQDADLTLPFPATKGALDFGKMPVVSVSSNAPRLVSLTATEPSGTVFYVGDSILFIVSFSAPVCVSGRPRLKLETGNIDRYATYVNGSNSSSIVFSYTVSPGDDSNRLEYWSDANDERVSLDSFELPDGAWIRLLSAKPVVDADIRLSPPNAVLMSASGTIYNGGKTAKVSALGPAGVAYLDLAAASPGKQCMIRYAASHQSMPGFTFRASTSIDVAGSASTKLQVGDAGIFDLMEASHGSTDGAGRTSLMSHNQGPGDLFGWAVSADGTSGRLIAGAPGKARPLPEIQLLTVTGSALTPKPEVQAYGVGVLAQPAVQNFTVSAGAGAEVGGTFVMQYSDKDGNLLAAPAKIPATTNADTAASLLMDAYPDLGLVTASKTPYEWCACTGGAIWSITFDGLLGIGYGETGTLVLTPDGLTGTGASISAITRIHESAYTDGTWRLELTRDDGTFNATAPLLATATGDDVKYAIQDDLGYMVSNVDVSEYNAYGSRRWAVTFADIPGESRNDTGLLNNIPLLEAKEIALGGGPGASAWSTPIQDGGSPVWGHFGVSLNGAGPSEPIWHNADVDEVKAKLEGLDSISHVEVSNVDDLFGFGKGAHTYLVTFAAVLRKDDGGTWVGTSVYDMEPVKIDTKYYFGSHAEVQVLQGGYDPVTNYTTPVWTGARRGQRGAGGGAAFVYARTVVSSNDPTYMWSPEFALVPDPQHYAGERAAFGHDVALGEGGNTALVGAPYSENHGVFEVQSISCTAAGGFFRLGLMGAWTQYIKWNATVAELKDALRGRAFAPMLGLHAALLIEVASSDKYVCSNTSTSIRMTFEMPPTGPGFQTSRANLDPMEVNLEGDAILGIDGLYGNAHVKANVAITEVRRGTAQPLGVNARGENAGAAFVFKRVPVDATKYASSGSWAQEARLTGTTTFVGDRFGWCVALLDEGSTRVAAVGAPYAGVGDAGEVHIFSNTGSGWAAIIENEISDAGVYGQVQGDEFGFSVALSVRSNGFATLFVGAPGADDNRGAVYVFTSFSATDAATSGFVMFQRLTAEDGPSLHSGKRSRGDRFGCSVAIDEDDAVIGVCGAADKPRGRDATPTRLGVAKATGAVVVLQRACALCKYVFAERLLATNTGRGDRLGHRVAIDDGIIVATGVGDIQGAFDRGEPPDLGGLGPQRSVWQVRTKKKCAPIGANDRSRPSHSGALRKVTPEECELGGRWKIGFRSTNHSKLHALCRDDAHYANLGARVCEGVKDIVSREKRVQDTILQSDNMTEGQRTRWSLEIAKDADYLDVEYALEHELLSGEVTVTGTVLVESGEHAWNVTFSGSGDLEILPSLEADGSRLLNGYAEVEELRPMPARLRGVAHMFTREAGRFVEQALLRPFLAQRQDAYGIGATVSGDIAAVGAPNTDSVASGDNAGAVFAADINWVTLGFESANYSVSEGSTVDVVLARRNNEYISKSPERPVSFFLWTFARNADQTQQKWLADLYGLWGDRAVPAAATAAEVVGAGSAHARASWYGGLSNSSAWVDGSRDDYGASDFVPIGKRGQLAPLHLENYRLPDSLTKRYSLPVETTQDFIYEKPDEDIIVGVWLPGMFPSPLGHLRTTVTVEDDGDGLDGRVAAFERLGESDEVVEGIARPDASRDDRRGAGAALCAFNDTKGGKYTSDDPFHVDMVAALGAPAHNASRGQVVVYRRQWGLWAFEQALAPRDVPSEIYDENASSTRPPFDVEERFGESLAGSAAHGRRNGATLLVGAPGASKVYAFTKSNVTLGLPLLMNAYGNETLQNATEGDLKWTLEATLEHPDAYRAKHNFGSRGAVALDGDCAVVGASGVEAVYVYRRIYSHTHKNWKWTFVERLRSSDYDYDVLLDGLLTKVHEQGFGAAVAFSENALAVGAPFADYGNRGVVGDAETRDTDGTDNRRLGRGRVYLYYSTPPEVVVTLRADTVLSNGTWKLGLDDYRNGSCSTNELGLVITADVLKRELDDACAPLLAGLQIEVTRQDSVLPTASGGGRLAWTVTFFGEAGDAPPLKPTWRGSGCWQCDKFNDGWAQYPSRQVLAEPKPDAAYQGHRGPFLEVGKLQAEDRTSGSYYGASLDLDKDALIIGAPRAPGVASTTWDFETGDLTGWRQSGDAFVEQPTFGDGPKYRPNGEGGFGSDGSKLVGGKPQAALPKGRYFVGTKDDRGRKNGSYIDPFTNSAGTSQGDEPTGTLTAEPVTIPYAHTTIHSNDLLTVSFLVGGGCDARTEYVELLIDGVPVDRATGTCHERLRNASFDLTPFQGRTAVLRVVDASKSRWGHVNVDHVRWNWPSRGFGAGRRAGVTAVTPNDADAVDLAHEEKNEVWSTGAGFAGETSRAGAAYAYRRRDPLNPDQGCFGEKEKCVWELASKLLPSDRRRNDNFGWSVAISDETGRAAVGAPGASATTHWKLAPPKRPVGRAPPRDAPTAWTQYLKDYDTSHVDSPFVDRGAPVRLPMDQYDKEKSSRDLRMQSRQDVPSPSGAQAVWSQRSRDIVDGVEAPPASPALDEAKQAGAVYVFERSIPDVNPVTEETLIPARWAALETARLQAPERMARAFLGSSVAFAGRSVLGGQPGGSSFGTSAGDALVWDTDVLRVRFLAAEFAVVEGFQRTATITIVRDFDYSQNELTVGYSTEDLTARGIDEEAWLSCSGGPTDSAAVTGCGDYLQAAGTTAFGKGEIAAFFYVNIVDDPCTEVAEYVQLSLSIPGAPALQGEQFLARLRIDDDDFPELAKTELCADTGFL